MLICLVYPRRLFDADSLFILLVLYLILLFTVLLILKFVEFSNFVCSLDTCNIPDRNRITAEANGTPKYYPFT